MKQLKNHIIVLATLTLCLGFPSNWAADQENSDQTNDATESTQAITTTQTDDIANDSIQTQALEQREISETGSVFYPYRWLHPRSTVCKR